MDKFWEYYQEFATFAYDHNDTIILVSGLSIGMGILALNIRARKVRKAFKKMKALLRGKTMTRAEREARDKTIQGDAIFEALMGLVESGKQTEYQVNRTLRILANVLNMPDFVSVKGLDVSHLTKDEFEILQSLLRSKKEFQKLMFAKKRANIPGAKPGEVDNVHVFGAHKFGGKLLVATKPTFGGNLLRKTAVV